MKIREAFRQISEDLYKLEATDTELEQIANEVDDEDQSVDLSFEEKLANFADKLSLLAIKE